METASGPNGPTYVAPELLVGPARHSIYGQVVLELLRWASRPGIVAVLSEASPFLFIRRLLPRDHQLGIIEVAPLHPPDDTHTQR